MEDRVMDLLTQLVEGQKQLFEGQKQLFEGQKQTNERLDRMETRMDRMETRMDRMEVRMDNLEDHMASMDKRMDSIEQRVTKTEVLLENRVLPQLQLLAEGHTALSERLDQLDEKFAKKEDVEVLQLAVRRHTEEIQEIKAAM